MWAVLGGGMYWKMEHTMATEATAMGEVMEAMATGEARRVMMEQEPEPVSRLYIAVSDNT